MLSAIVWSFDQTKRVGSIHFSATAEEHRNNGYYKRLLTVVETSMKSKGAVVLYSGVHIDNQLMIDIAESTNRKRAFYRVKKYLDDRSES